MSDRDDRKKPEWGWPSQIEFSDEPFSGNPVIMLILLGGMLTGLAIAFWYLPGF